MLKRFTYALLAFTLVFASCSDTGNPAPPPYVPPDPYASGIIYYGTTTEDISFYDPAKKEFYEGNIFEEVNGETVGTSTWEGGINSVHIRGGKAYFLTPTTSEEGANAGKARIAVTDAETFELEKSIYAEGFDMASLGQIYSLMVVDENKFYISHNTSVWSTGENTSGIGMLKVNQDGSTTFTRYIEDTYGDLGTDGPALYQSMLRHNNWVIAPCGSRVQFINTATDQVEKTIPVSEDRQVVDVIKGRDGYIYALVSGEVDKTPDPYGWPWLVFYDSEASVIKIDPVTLTKLGETLVVDEYGDQIDMKGGAEGNGAVASLTTDEILFTTGMPYMVTQVYAYNYTTRTTRFVANTTRGDGKAWTITKSMAVDKRGNLYIPLQMSGNYADISVGVYSVAGDNDRKTDIEAEFTALPGDGGFVSTYQFE